MGWHGVILRDENFTQDLFWRSLWVYSEDIQPPDGDFWMLVRNLDACAELASGNIMSGFILVPGIPGGRAAQLPRHFIRDPGAWKTHFGKLLEFGEGEMIWNDNRHVMLLR